MPPLRSKRDPLIKWVEANARFHRQTLYLGLGIFNAITNKVYIVLW